MEHPETIARTGEGTAQRGEAHTWPAHVLTHVQLDATELLLDGALAPGSLTLAVPKALAREVAGSRRPRVALRAPDRALLAALTVESVERRDDGAWCLAGSAERLGRIERPGSPVPWSTPADLRSDFAAMGSPPVLLYAPRGPMTPRLARAAAQAASDLGAALLLQAAVPSASADEPAQVVHLMSLEAARRQVAAEGTAVRATARPWLAEAGGALARAYGATHLLVDDGEGGDLAGSDVEVVALPPAPGNGAHFPEVAALLRQLHPPRAEQGFAVLLTGLSGAGKSTIARALVAELTGAGRPRVTLLDGDVVRQHLSSELGFSRAHRDLNIQRIGFVASEIARHGGVAVCAPIAPYAAARAAVRELVERRGGFVLVHVATSLRVCEARDRKGLYAAARSGHLPAFTGVSDPYEVPEDAEVTVDTVGRTPEECAQAVIAWLTAQGYLPRRGNGA